MKGGFFPPDVYPDNILAFIWRLLAETNKEIETLSQRGKTTPELFDWADSFTTDFQEIIEKVEGYREILLKEGFSGLSITFSPEYPPRIGATIHFNESIAEPREDK